MIQRMLKSLPHLTPKRALSLVLMLAVLCAAGGGAFFTGRAFTMYRFGGKAPSEQATLAPEFVTPGAETQVTPLPANIAEIIASLTPWDGSTRVTALIMGIDYRDWAAQEEAARSDTMILLTLDPLTKTAGMLSIPRDLWVAIPGFQHGKINTAYYLGDIHKLPGGGPALAVKTVENLLGVPIHFYAQIDFGAFVRFIDEIGGVLIDVPEPIRIDLLGGGFKTIKKLQPGKQVLPGEWALAYARARNTEGGDFDRAMRQQQVIMAIRQRILEPEVLPTLITKAPTLYNELAAGIRTNLTLEQVLRLALLAQSIPDENIQRGLIGKDSVLFAKSPDGLDILIPLPDKIHLLRDQIFATSSGLGPLTEGDDQARMLAEGARIAIYNGSSLAGLAERTADYLRNLGVNIVQVANAAQPYAATTIVDHRGSPFSLKFFVNWMGIKAGRIVIQFDPNATADVEIFLGEDWAVSNPLP